jgi:hypothetical protein
MRCEIPVVVVAVTQGHLDHTRGLGRDGVSEMGGVPLAFVTGLA